MTGSVEEETAEIIDPNEILGEVTDTDIFEDEDSDGGNTEDGSDQ